MPETGYLRIDGKRILDGLKEPLYLGEGFLPSMSGDYYKDYEKYREFAIITYDKMPGKRLQDTIFYELRYCIKK